MKRLLRRELTEIHGSRRRDHAAQRLRFRAVVRNIIYEDSDAAIQPSGRVFDGDRGSDRVDPGRQPSRKSDRGLHVVDVAFRRLFRRRCLRRLLVGIGHSRTGLLKHRGRLLCGRPAAVFGLTRALLRHLIFILFISGRLRFPFLSGNRFGHLRQVVDRPQSRGAFTAADRLILFFLLFLLLRYIFLFRRRLDLRLCQLFVFLLPDAQILQKIQICIAVSADGNNSSARHLQPAAEHSAFHQRVVNDLRFPERACGVHWNDNRRILYNFNFSLLRNRIASVHANQNDLLNISL